MPVPWALAACGLLSVGLHVLLLLFGQPGTGSDALRPLPYRPAEALHAVRVRVIEDRPARKPPTVQPREASLPQESPTASQEAPAKKSGQVPAPGSPASASGGTSPEAPPPPSEFDAYLPRHLLSDPPVALTDIVIEAPAEGEFPGRRIGILTLFIDEEGQVRHVAPDDILLPPALEKAAREAFMAGRFSPGRLAGTPAKSRMRVEVVFE